ncbi:MAG: hypothetical protein MMC23_009529 [Stictis urceolatum]|nr:hypothetical protein [Stictis urceolata]
MAGNPFDDDSESDGDHRARYQNLALKHSSKRHVESAQELDASVYEYDAVYDSLHAQPKKKSAAKDPKYVQGLLKSAEVRKRDQLQAKDKVLAREREAEGKEFADKEKFVTGAYRAQQEEVRRLAEEEKKRETEDTERKRRGGGGMTSLYKGMLEREEQRHVAINQAMLKGSQVTEPAADDKRRIEADIASLEGAAVNDEGQVVDKRQLLKAGLNVATKPKGVGNQHEQAQEAQRNEISSRHITSGGAKNATRERQTRLLEAQLEQAAKRAADDDQVEQEALRRSAKSKKTEQDISSARMRYLERKKEAQAARTMEKNV